MNEYKEINELTKRFNNERELAIIVSTIKAVFSDIETGESEILQ